MFTIQKDRRGVDQAQFHVPPATSLLRLHDPAQHGDDLTRFRPIVAAVNRERAARKGYAIARRGPAIFGVVPISDAQGAHIGSFEFGLDFGPLIDGLKAAYGLDFSLYIEERPLREFARAVDPAVLSDQNRVGRFVQFHTTNRALMRDLVADADIAVVNEPVRYTREAQGVPHGILLVALRDGAGDSLGVIAAARDFSSSRAASGRSLVWQICLAIFAIVILAGAVIVVIRGLLLRPLEIVVGRFVGLTSGSSSAPIEGADRFVAELRPLVELHDRIAGRRAREGGK
jgi:methyl-accepting chemotaxis protein